VIYLGGNPGIARSLDGGITWEKVLDHYDVRALVVSGGTVFAVTATGFLRGSNRGSSWRSLGRGLPTLDLAALALDPRRPIVLYAAGANGGIFRSADGGSTWISTPAARAVPAPRALLVPSRGASWTRHAFDCLSPRALALSPAGAAGELYVAGFSRCAGTEVEEGGIERSTDGGATFENLHQGLPTSRDAHAVAVDPRAPEILLRQVSGQTQPPTSPLEIAFYRSADHGASWSRVATLERLPSLIQGFAFPRATPEATWMATDGQGLLFSADAGATWSAANPAPPSFRIFGLALGGGAEEALYAGTSGGLFRRVDP
jgi:hypothetical protein